jgi:hypothetical protein
MHSCPIIIIIIFGLVSINEWEHTIFGFLTWLTQHDDLWFHPFSYKWHNFIFYGWVIFSAMSILFYVIIDHLNILFNYSSHFNEVDCLMLGLSVLFIHFEYKSFFGHMCYKSFISL